MSRAAVMVAFVVGYGGLPVRDFEASTLWRVSEFERVRNATGTSGFTPLDSDTLLPSTLLADLDRIDITREGMDILAVTAACMRHRESALLLFAHDDLVWPVTLFPQQMMFHSPVDMMAAPHTGLARLRLLSVDPPGVRPPGHWRNDRVADLAHYRPLQPLLWQLAMHGPRNQLLDEIAGAAAYRATRGEGEPLRIPGAIGSGVERLHQASVSLAEISRWPGFGPERASRMLNGLYLSACLMVLRSYPGVPAGRPTWPRPRARR